MKITDLDEFQGLAGTDVHAWMLRNGWKRTEDDFVFERSSERGSTVLRALLNDDLLRLASEHRLSPQALLREINPRMRKGMPSDAALAEHDEWIVCTPFGATFIAEISYGGSDDGFSIMMPPINDHCDAEFIAEKHWPECLFWPCDANGNKVRWPTDENGNML